MAFNSLAGNQMVTEIEAATSTFALNSGKSQGSSSECMTKAKAIDKYVLSGASTEPFASNQLLPKDAWVAGNCSFSANFVSVETLPALISSISWNKSSSPTTDPGCYTVSTTDPTPQGWAVTNNNYTLRYNIANAVGCPGGTCSVIQTGTATATITVGPSPVKMYIYFEGLGEAQDADFEKITFVLDSVLVAKANAPGGKLGCTMGPVVKQFIVAQPYLLAANSVHTLAIDFTTNDALYHVNAYYEINLSFTL